MSPVLRQLIVRPDCSRAVDSEIRANFGIRRRARRVLWTVLGGLWMIGVGLNAASVGFDPRIRQGGGRVGAYRSQITSIFSDGFESGDTSAWSAVEGEIWRPPPGTSWQWQLQGTIDTTIDVEMYDIDLFDTPEQTIADLGADGRVVICYFSAGSWEDWRPDAGDYPAVVLGNTLAGWPDEKWVDIRRLDLLGPILEARLDLARSKGCTGIEPDNVDAYQNSSGFPLVAADQLVFNRWLAAEAHQRGLSIGLKNDLDQVADLVAEFDWALNEQCFEYAECALLQPFIDAGKAVFGVEYSGDETVFCPTFNALGYSWLKKEEDLGVWRIDCHDIR